MVLTGGEFTTDTYVDIQNLAWDMVKGIGYTNPDCRIDYKSMAILNSIHAQSQDISQRAVDQGLKEYGGQQGAGDPACYSAQLVLKLQRIYPLRSCTHISHA